ncbi:WD40 repeat domain-containing protein [Ekhidna sp. To15]|uniref:WD40 repeat domain-containing protein n=1 Tax=Ekhidna sp. To15 TaxID=3395267 RepID=UPI003F524663
MGKINVKKLHTFLGHNDSIYTLESLDDNRFISAGGDGMVVLWDLKSPDEGEVIVKIEGSVYAVAYDPEEGFLYVGQNNEGVHKIDLKEKKEVASIQLGDHQIFDLKIINDQVWVGLSDGEIVSLSKDLLITNRIKHSNDRVRNFDVFENKVAVAYSDNITRIIDASTMEILHELKGHKNSVFAARYHPSGKYVITGGRDAQLKVWDSQADYVQRESIAAHLYTINDVIFRKDGRYFVTASMDKAIKLWDAHNFRLLKVLDKHRHAGHGNSVNKLLWMNYRDLLVTCSDDRSISVWETKFEE